MGFTLYNALLTYHKIPSILNVISVSVELYKLYTNSILTYFLIYQSLLPIC
ncbi:hypothetical protein PIROE2DRAFT_16903 [Piromyces sp. E2]|nr:hypothetical protein PIROE2DRAFT_16903 [Piromyces sp. E2]|eukprot:OUM57950.1 hypothetical protein PIROE2DRAFT_16903 [Piromyces sp. E2]